MLFKIFLFIAFSLSLFTEEIDPFASSSLASTEGIVSSVVAGHVSVISGDFLVHAEDMALPGPNPLRLRRNYCSGDTQGIFMGKSWQLVEPTTLTYGQTKSTGTGFAVLTTPHGARAYYTKSLKEKPEGRTLFEFVPVKGYTNCGSGKLSGQTNIKNNVLHLNNRDKKMGLAGDLVSGDGTKQLYQYYDSDPVHNMVGYWIYEESKQDWTKKYFSYNSGDISLITQTNWNTNQTYGTLKFKWLSKHKLEIKSSTDKSITYHLKKKEWEDTKSYYLEKVENPEKPTVEYKYQKSKRHDKHLIISEMLLPEDRGLKVFYNDKGKYADRVKEIQAPLGEEGAFCTAYRFEYDLNIINDELMNGTTNVFDALNRKTTYHFDREERLKYVVHVNLPGSAHSINAYYFGEKGSSHEGNLLAEYLQDPVHNPIKGKTFDYDDQGNVIRTETYASITGKNNSPIVLEDNGRPIDNGTEHYGKSFTYGENNLVLSEREDNGKQIRYTYHPYSNAISSKILLNGSDEILLKETYEYDSNLFLTKKTVENGDAVLITCYIPRKVAPFGLPQEVIEKSSQEVQLRRFVNHHSIEGRLIQQDHYNCNNHLCYSLHWEHDAHGNITKEVNAAREVTVRSYDENDNLIYEKAHDVEKLMTYDHMNRLTILEERHPDGVVFIEETSYDLVCNVTSKKDLRGNVTHYTYNDQNRLITIQHPEVPFNGELVRPQEHFGYDILGNKIFHQDKSGNITHTLCNAQGNPLKITYPDGALEQFEYYPNGDLQKAIYKNESYTIYSRDCLGRVTIEQEFTPEHALLSEKAFIYNGTLLITEIDPEGTATHYTYDSAGRLIKKQTEDKKTTFSYDHLGRVGTQTDWIDDNTSRTTSYVYDHKNQITQETLSDSSGNVFFTTKYTYNSFGQKTKIRCGKVFETFDYNTRQELVKHIDANRNKTYHEYVYTHTQDGWTGSKTTTIDPMGQRTTSIQDPLGRTLETSISNFKLLSQTKFSYDLSDNLLKAEVAKIIDGTIHSWFNREWTYNAVHDVTSLCEADAKTTKYLYNSFGQKTAVEKPDGVTLHSTYDPKGRLQDYYSSDNTIFYRYTYDKNDHVTQVHDLVNDQTTLHAYDPHGRLIEETLGNGFTLQSSYDPFDRKKSLHFLNQSVNYQYDPSFLREIHYGDITCTRDNYDAYGNLLQSTLPNNCGIVTHDYDIMQRKLSAVHPCFSHTIDKKWGFDKMGNVIKDKFQDQARKFAYDELYQLTLESGFEAHTYAYDSLSNRILKNNSPCTVNPLNCLLAHEEALYTYDLNGNRIKKEERGEVTTYTYDALNRMMEAKTPENTVQYTYDPFDRRLTKTINGIIEHYIYDDQNEIGMVQNGELQQFRILDPSYPSEHGAAIYLQFVDKGYTPLHDIYGNVAVLLTEGGAPIKTYQYSAFGVEVNVSHDINPWRYASKRFDPETGLIYFGRRYYDPQVARWSSPDPAEDVDGPNLYAYLHNNPINRWDSHGLWMEEEYSCYELGFGEGYGLSYMDQCQTQAGFGYGIAKGCFNMFMGFAHAFGGNPSMMSMDFEDNRENAEFFDSKTKFKDDGWFGRDSLTGKIGDHAAPGLMRCIRGTASTQFEGAADYGEAIVETLGVAAIVRTAARGACSLGRSAISWLGAGLLAPKVAPVVESICARGTANTIAKGREVIHVTPDGVALNADLKYQIPKHFVENIDRSGCYGEIINGKFVEKLRIDPATPPGKKGPNHSHYHLKGKRTHYSPRPGSPNPGFDP